MTYSYSSGTWTAVATGSGLALLDPQIPARVLRALWQVMSQELPIGSWLETLAGGGISALPGFALVQREQHQVRVLVRGEAAVELDDVLVQAEGMSTWREHVASGVEQIVLRSPGQSGELWPLAGGVVLATALHGQPASDDPASTAAAAAGVQVPAPAPNVDRAEDAALAPAHREEPVRLPEDEPAGAPAPEVLGEADDEASAGAAEDGVAAPVEDDVVVPPLTVSQAQEMPAARSAGAEGSTPLEPGEHHEPAAAAPEAVAEPAEEAEQGTSTSQLATHAPETDAGAAPAESAPDADLAAMHDPSRVADESVIDPQETEERIEDDRGVIDSLPWDVPALKGDQDTPEDADEPPGTSGAGVGEPSAPETGERPEHAVAEDGSVAAGDERAGYQPQGAEPAADEPAEAQSGTGGQAPVSLTAGTMPDAGAVADQADQADDDEGDHDGHTVLVSHVRDINSQGEDNPDDSTIVPSTEPAVPPPPALAISTGQRVDLDRPALIGRAPESARFEGPVAPRLVAVPSPQQDISRNHVEVRPEGSHVLVTDLRSTNGTVLTVPHSEPRRLHPGEAVPVGHGAVIDLGDGITMMIELGGGGPMPPDPGYPGQAQASAQPEYGAAHYPGAAPAPGPAPYGGPAPGGVH